MKNVENQFQNWYENAPELRPFLDNMEQNEIEDAFCRNLEFGTGGLRGVLGPGSNRMNVYVVARASQGVADYLHNVKGSRVALSYDTRRLSRQFAETAASVFAANGIKVFLFSQEMPTPCLSFATRYYKCDAGIMVTASHNPPEYNGYKVYGADGCQITNAAAELIQKEIDKLDYFKQILKADFKEELSRGMIEYISEECFIAYAKEVAAAAFPEIPAEPLRIVYTPLNGTGRMPVATVLKQAGFDDVLLVPEQEWPDEDFTTCASPNPENKEALTLALQYASRDEADLVLGTDPDSDRLGVAVRDDGAYRLLSGNEVGLLLFQFICEQHLFPASADKKPVLIKTIVTTELARIIADAFGIETIDVLTGFKYIGEQIGLLEQHEEADRFVFGFEESCGYLRGTYVRDKDAVVAALMVSKMCACYKKQGKNLAQKLNEIYAAYGYQLDTLHSFSFPGVSGMNRIRTIMDDLRNRNDTLGCFPIQSKIDYINGLNGLPKSDTIRFVFEGGQSVVIRPSGTEPKLKAYISVHESNMEQAETIENAILKELQKIFKEEH